VRLRLHGGFVPHYRTPVKHHTYLCGAGLDHTPRTHAPAGRLDDIRFVTADGPCTGFNLPIHTPYLSAAFDYGWFTHYGERPPYCRARYHPERTRGGYPVAIPRTLTS